MQSKPEPFVVTEIVSRETIPVQIDWPPEMWGEPPQVGDRYALEVYHVADGENGNIVAKLRPVKL